MYELVEQKTSFCYTRVLYFGIHHLERSTNCTSVWTYRCFLWLCSLQPRFGCIEKNGMFRESLFQTGNWKLWKSRSYPKKQNVLVPSSIILNINLWNCLFFYCLGTMKMVLVNFCPTNLSIVIRDDVPIIFYISSWIVLFYHSRHFI